MYPFLLQDWVTIQGGSTTSAVTQTELSWLDTSAFLDLVTWLDVKEVSASAGSVYCAFQTAPTKDEALFAAMNDVTSGSAIPMSQTLMLGVYLRDTALCPLSHWLRWQLTAPGGGTWHATFRIWVAANQPGGFATDGYGFADAYGGASADGGPAWTTGPTGGSGQSPTIPVPFNLAAQHARKGSLQHPQLGNEAERPGNRLAYNSFRRAEIRPTATVYRGQTPRARGMVINEQSRGVPPAGGNSNWNPHLPPGTLGAGTNIKSQK